MDQHWKESFYGHVRVTITGRLLEQFINRCVREDIKLWNIKRINEKSIACSILLTDTKRIKRVLKDTECKIHFRNRKGFPFLIKKIVNRQGLVIGLVAFLAVLFILSNMIWNINVSGADPKVEHQIRSLLQKMDIHRGAIQFLLPSTEKTEYQLTQQVKSVTWIGLSVDGTTLNIKVVQKTVPKKENDTGPQSLYARKEAIIHHLFVEKGQPMVKANQYVEKGDLLVSGEIGTEDDPKTVAAKGEVIGETWYHSETSVPLVTHLKTFTGHTYEQDKLSIFGYQLPIWGFNVPKYKSSQVDEITRPFHFLNWELPIGLNRYIHRETVDRTKKISEKEAIAIGKRDSQQTLEDKLPKGAKIISEKIWRNETDNGIVKLIINYVVYENIAEAKPIIQGD